MNTLQINDVTQVALSLGETAGQVRFDHAQTEQEGEVLNQLTMTFDLDDEVQKYHFGIFTILINWEVVMFLGAKTVIAKVRSAAEGREQGVVRCELSEDLSVLPA